MPKHKQKIVIKNAHMKLTKEGKQLGSDRKQRW